jgi:hypothetical protein
MLPTVSTGELAGKIVSRPMIVAKILGFRAVLCAWLERLSKILTMLNVYNY